MSKTVKQEERKPRKCFVPAEHNLTSHKSRLATADFSEYIINFSNSVCGSGNALK